MIIMIIIIFFFFFSSHRTSHLLRLLLGRPKRVLPVILRLKILESGASTFGAGVAQSV
jgi:hypothetical protein